MAGPEAWAPAMKARQKGKKKGGSKERVFGCDLQDHLRHSGQEGKAGRGGREGLGAPSRRGAGEAGSFVKKAGPSGGNGGSLGLKGGLGEGWESRRRHWGGSW